MAATIGLLWGQEENLFGADFWIDTFDVRRGETMTILVNNQARTIRNARLTRVGDRVNYDYDSYITYIGGFSEIKYDRGPLTAVLVLAGTQNRFQRQENFRYRPEDRPSVPLSSLSSPMWRKRAWAYASPTRGFSLPMEATSPGRPSFSFSS